MVLDSTGDSLKAWLRGGGSLWIEFYFRFVTFIHMLISLV